VWHRSITAPAGPGHKVQIGSKKRLVLPSPVVTVDSGIQVNRLWFPKKWEVVPVLDPLAPFIAYGYSARRCRIIRAAAELVPGVKDARRGRGG
jgi:hypothetical protein